MQIIDAAIGVVLPGMGIVISQRKDSDTFGGFWELAESLEQCLARELFEELNICVRPLCMLPPTDHEYPQAKIRYQH